MNYGDFSSVVQLGVSLHLGTALLQFYGDLGVQPLVRIMGRIKGLFGDADSKPSNDVKSALALLESDFEIFKIRLFNEYRKYVVLNSGVAFVLIAVLVTIAYVAQTAAETWLTILIVALSTVPAPATLFALSIDASRVLKPLIERADVLEQRALRGR